MTAPETINGVPIEEYVPYTLADASKLSGVSARRLREWDASGLLVPARAEPDRRRPFSRWYNLRDIVAARLLARLRDSVAEGEMRRIQPWVRSQRGVVWESLRVRRTNGRLELLTGEPRSDSSLSNGHDGYDDLPLGDIVAGLRSDIEEHRRRDPSTIGKISRHRHIMQNAWVVDGTRVPTKSVWDMRQEGFTDADILRQFPMITSEDIEAAIAHEKRSRGKGTA